MKKLLVLALLTMTMAVSHAQFGFKGGVNVSTLHGDDVDANDVKSGIGIYLGAFYNFHATDHFAIEPQVVFQTTGVKEDGGDESLRFSYISITGLLKYTTPSGFFIGAGPQLDFLMSAKAKEDGVPDEDIKDFVKSTSFDIATAIGYDMKCGLGVYARFNFGLGKMFEDAFDFDAKQNVAQFGLRYRFHNSPPPPPR